MYHVEEGEPMWKDGPPAPYAGYITKGDNSETNPSYDQQGSISPLQPVKKEWIIGVARFYRVPLLGCISLIPRGNFACLKL
jgi:signal peptidase